MGNQYQTKQQQMNTKKNLSPDIFQPLIVCFTPGSINVLIVAMLGTDSGYIILTG